MAKAKKETKERIDILRNSKERIERALYEQRAESIMRQGNISLILASYDDIFSDFDPRHFSEKALSDDFLSECRKASRDKNDGTIALRLLIPQEKRKTYEEEMIRHRIKDHFHKHMLEKQKEAKKRRSEGALWSFAGVCLILIATALYKHHGESFYYDLFFVIMEPAGWFTIWNGLEKLVEDQSEKSQDYDFYRKMSGAEIEFHSY